MTPILVLVFKIDPLTAVSSDLVASLVMKPIGAGVHLRRRAVNLRLVRWLCLGSVPGLRSPASSSSSHWAMASSSGSGYKFPAWGRRCCSPRSRCWPRVWWPLAAPLPIRLMMRRTST